MENQETILFEGELDPTFFDEVAALPEGAHLRSCIQCGTCGGTCPVSPMLPHTPRKLFAMIRAGMKDAVLSSPTPWVCSSCYECTVKCPAEIKITELMYALKRRAIREGVRCEDSDADRFLRQFTRIVAKNGRSHELSLLMRYMMFKHPIQMLKQTGLGLRMMGKGRMPLFSHKVRDKEGYSRMVEKALELGAQEGGAQ